MIDFTNTRMRLYLETDDGEPVIDGPINGGGEEVIALVQRHSTDEDLAGLQAPTNPEDPTYLQQIFSYAAHALGVIGSPRISLHIGNVARVKYHHGRPHLFLETSQ